jgi:hypothetical protein
MLVYSIGGTEITTNTGVFFEAAKARVAALPEETEDQGESN